MRREKLWGPGTCLRVCRDTVGYTDPDTHTQEEVMERGGCLLDLFLITQTAQELMSAMGGPGAPRV